MNSNQIKEYIISLENKYKFRPLPKYIKEETYDIYNSNLNGFNKDKPNKLITVNNIILSDTYNRIVVGDYGAYLEIDSSNIDVNILQVPHNQTWRLNREWCISKGINLKYIHYEFQGKKIYYQLGTVKYADYKVGYYYISPLDTD